MLTPKHIATQAMMLLDYSIPPCQKCNSSSRGTATLSINVCRNAKSPRSVFGSTEHFIQCETASRYVNERFPFSSVIHLKSVCISVASFGRASVPRSASCRCVSKRSLSLISRSTLARVRRLVLSCIKSASFRLCSGRVWLAHWWIAQP